MTAVGYGVLGLRDGLRAFAEFMEGSASEKNVLVEMTPRQEVVEGWSVYSGSCYETPLYRLYHRYGEPVSALTNDTLRDVVAVRSGLDAGLVRAESLALCVSTPGTYFYDPEASFTQAARWDDGVTFWDDGVTLWDQVPKLYVHLTDNSSPSSTTVAASYGYFFSMRGVVHPRLGPDKLTDGGVEVWTSSSNLTSFTEVTSGVGWAVRQVTSSPIKGASSAAFDYGTVSGQATAYQDSVPAVAGKLYRVAGSYSTPAGHASVAVVRVSDAGGSNNAVLADGRNYQNATFLSLAPTHGETRRFVLDFVAKSASLRLEFGANTGSGPAAAGSVVFDDVSLRRIYRFNYYEPRISSSAIPAYDAGVNDLLFGGQRIGVGGVKVINGDGRMEADLGELVWKGSECLVLYGGTFADGQRMTIDDYQRSFVGSVTDTEESDAEFSFSLQDVKAFYNLTIPADTYTATSHPNAAPATQGQLRPILFGVMGRIRPYRVDRVGEYGVYEVADTSKSPAGLFGVSSVLAYDDDGAANSDDATLRSVLTEGTDYSLNLTLGTVTILRDVGPYIVTDSNNKLNFHVGAAELTATLVEGVYSAADLAAQIQLQMRAAVGGADTTCSCAYSETTHLWTIAKSSGTLVLKIADGTNKEIAPWGLIGFKKGANRTGSLSYVGEEVTFTDVDVDHVIQVDPNGYKDDGAGSCTGTPGALVQLGPDITRFVMRYLLKKSTSIIDLASFAAARATASQQLGIYLKEKTRVRELFDKLEFSTLATISVDGDGMLFYDVFSVSPAVVADVQERDILGFKTGSKIVDVFKGVQVRWNQNQATGDWNAASDTDESVAILYDRSDVKTVDTYCKLLNDATRNAIAIRQLLGGGKRRAVVSVRGKLLRARLGQVVTITRARSVAPTLAATQFRILKVRHVFTTGTSDVELLEV